MGHFWWWSTEKWLVWKNLYFAKIFSPSNRRVTRPRKYVNSTFKTFPNMFATYFPWLQKKLWSSVGWKYFYFCKFFANFTKKLSPTFEVFGHFEGMREFFRKFRAKKYISRPRLGHNFIHINEQVVATMSKETYNGVTS